jgi:hypothetical protein
MMRTCAKCGNRAVSGDENRDTFRCEDCGFASTSFMFLRGARIPRRSFRKMSRAALREWWELVGLREQMPLWLAEGDSS